MTREEAREALSVLKIYDAQWLREAVDMAIEALQEKERAITDIITYCDVFAECENCPIYGKSCCGERKD